MRGFSKLTATVSAVLVAVAVVGTAPDLALAQRDDLQTQAPRGDENTQAPRGDENSQAPRQEDEQAPRGSHN